MSKSLKKKRGKEATSNFNICIFLYNRCYIQWWCLVAHFITNIETALGHSVVIFLKCIWLYNWSKSLILWFEAFCNLTSASIAKGIQGHTYVKTGTLYFLSMLIFAYSMNNREKANRYRCEQLLWDKHWSSCPSLNCCQHILNRRIWEAHI